MIVIFGPTAVGKSFYSYELAQKVGGEIINMDSLQVYKEINIGTAKPSQDEFLRCPHHLFNCVEVDEDFSVYQYQKLALETIQGIESRGKVPILVGGTGLYLSSLYYDYTFRDYSDHNRFDTFSTEEMAKKLFEKDEELYQKIDPKNRHQVINAYLTGEILPKQDRVKREIDIKILSITRERSELYDRINHRVDQMFEEGLLEEFEDLRKKYNLTREHSSMKAIGYKELFDLVEGNRDLQDTKELIKKNTRHYAKRQITWIKHQYDPSDVEEISL